PAPATAQVAALPIVAAPPTAPVDAATSTTSSPARAATHAATSAVQTAEPGDELEALLVEADVARTSHRHAPAAAALERVLRERPDDPRAGLAAFTLGRLRERDLGDALGAAEAYAQALALGVSGA